MTSLLLSRISINMALPNQQTVDYPSFKLVIVGDGGTDTMCSENEDSSAVRRRVSCTKCFDALWFCYSPFYQMQQYYRVGRLDDCTKKFSDLFDCLSLKTKKASEAEKILEEQEMADAAKHIWIMRTQEEASSHWNETFGHLDDPNC